MNSTTFESTYAMLVRAEHEEERSPFETGVYLLLMLSMIFTMGVVAQMRVTIPESLTPRHVATATIAQCVRC